MTVSPLPLLVVVISRARACTRSRPDERAFSPANQRSRTSANGCTNADALRGLLFPGFRIMVTPPVVLSAGDRNCQCERENY